MQTILIMIFLKGWRPYFWLALVGSIIYFRTLFYGLVYYDDYYLLDNIKLFGHFPDFFKVFLSGVYLRQASAIYRPLLIVSIITDAWIGGGQIYVYHLTNLILHLAAGSLVFILLQKLNYQRWQAFLGALAFVAHPALTQAVAWFPGRNDILLAVFSIPAFIFLIDRWQAPNWRRYAGHFLFFLLALLTKETAIVIPLLGICYYYAIKKGRGFFRQERMLWYGWLIIISVWLALKQSVAIRSAQLTILSQINDLFSNLTALLPALVQYLGKIILPFDLSPLPVLPDINFGWGLAAAAVLGTLIFFSKSRRNGYVIFGLVWFALLLLPAFVYKGPYMMFLQENRLYLPIIGIAILILETDLLRQPKLPSLLVFLSVILLFGAVTIRYSDTYKDRISFWSAVTASSPSLPEGHVNMANIYLEENKLDLAEQTYKRAVELYPRFGSGWYGLAGVYYARGDFARAEELCKKAISFDPDLFEAHNLLGVIYFQQKDFASARASFQQAVAINPHHELAVKNLKAVNR